MLCNRCGAEIRDGPQFCQKCGKPPVGTASPANNAAKPREMAEAQMFKNHIDAAVNQHPVAGVVVVLVVVFAVIAFLGSLVGTPGGVRNPAAAAIERVKDDEVYKFRPQYQNGSWTAEPVRWNDELKECSPPEDCWTVSDTITVKGLPVVLYFHVELSKNIVGFGSVHPPCVEGAGLFLPRTTTQQATDPLRSCTASLLSSHRDWMKEDKTHHTSQTTASPFNTFTLSGDGLSKAVFLLPKPTQNTEYARVYVYSDLIVLNEQLYKLNEPQVQRLLEQAADSSEKVDLTEAARDRNEVRLLLSLYRLGNPTVTNLIKRQNIELHREEDGCLTLASFSSGRVFGSCGAS